MCTPGFSFRNGGRRMSRRAWGPSHVEPKRDPLPSLTGMRFIAASCVVANHALFINLFPPGLAGDWEIVIRQASWTSVGSFFVLSGFVLTWSARPGDAARTFYRRRFFRIYPQHLLTFVVAALLIGLVVKFPLDWHS